MSDDPAVAASTADGGLRSLDRRARAAAEARPWRGPLRHYDIVKEASIAVVIVAVLAVVLAWVLSSPDKPPVTLRQWADAQPAGFAQVAVSELQGTSTSATYGPPFNHQSGSVQHLGPISPQRWFGVAWPLDPARSFVLDPLATLPRDPVLRSAIRTWEAAPAGERAAWAGAYAKAVDRLGLGAGVPDRVPASGPVPELLTSLVGMARSGALDTALVTDGNFYSSNYTNAIMFLGDSATSQATSYWNQIVTAEHLQGNQWGVMNETGSFPGQPWLWLYTMWYQVQPMAGSKNADIEVIAIMAVLSLALLFLPFIPGLRSIPRWVPVHRIIWRQYYRQPADGGPAAAPRDTAPP